MQQCPAPSASLAVRKQWAVLTLQGPHTTQMRTRGKLPLEREELRR